MWQALCHCPTWVPQHGLFQFVPTGFYYKPLQVSTRELSLDLHTRKLGIQGVNASGSSPQPGPAGAFLSPGRENPPGCSTLSPKMPQGGWFAHRDTLLTLYRPLFLPTSFPTSLPVLPVIMSQINYLTLRSLPRSQLLGKPS